MNSVNFTANLVNKTNIPKRGKNDKYHPVQVSVVELDVDNPKDIEALYQTSVLWKDQGAKYSTYIYEEAVRGYLFDQTKAEHYLAVTEQKKDFDNLDSEKILGLMMFSELYDDEDEINWLQVRPNTNSLDSWIRQYKKVGTALIDTLKNTVKYKPIHVTSAGNSVGFYKEQGFTNRDDDKTRVSLYLEV